MMREVTIEIATLMATLIAPVQREAAGARRGPVQRKGAPLHRI